MLNNVFIRQADCERWIINATWLFVRWLFLSTLDWILISALNNSFIYTLALCSPVLCVTLHFLFFFFFPFFVPSFLPLYFIIFVRVAVLCALSHLFASVSGGVLLSIHFCLLICFAFLIQFWLSLLSHSRAHTHTASKEKRMPWQKVKLQTNSHRS